MMVDVIQIHPSFSHLTQVTIHLIAFELVKMEKKKPGELILR